MIELTENKPADPKSKSQHEPDTFNFNDQSISRSHQNQYKNSKHDNNPIQNFQKEIDDIAKKNHQSNPSNFDLDSISHKLSNAHITNFSLLDTLEEYIESEPTQPLKARLLYPSKRFIEYISDHFTQRLQSQQEFLIFIGSHNLNCTSIKVLFQSEQEVPFATREPKVALSQAEKSKIINLFQKITEPIQAQAFIIWDGLKDQNELKIDQAEPDPSDALSQNDSTLSNRWSARSLRIMIRRTTQSVHEITELRVACVGNVDSGKSTTLGVLTKGKLDDGRGKARVALFRHKHELDSGRTSSVGMEIMGFDAKGNEVLPVGLSGDKTNPNQVGLRKQQLSWDDICNRAAKVVSFIDLAGHERYLKTTIFGLTGCSPDFVLLIIGANAGLIGMSKEHLSVALALSVPVVAVITKVDMTPINVLEQTLKQLVKILKSPGCRKVPVFVKDDGMSCELAQNFVKERACPIFLISNVTGKGLGPLKVFLNTLPAGLSSQYPVDEPLEFTVSDAFSVPFVGTVVSGVILSGSLSTGQEVWLGPDSLGHFQLTTIKSMQRKRVHVEQAEAGQSVSVNLKRIKRNGVRKGMVILSRSIEPPPKATHKFEGQVLILYHNSTIQPNYQAMLHVGCVRQTVKILAIEKSQVLRTGDRAHVKFEFMKQPEFVKVGQKLLFREGKTKGLGVITKLID
ncbi:hypothetical protein O181_017817 [Austropuccinia psidii MF-1]|uniref:Tr-type G domain-containing protein n=1 Tax=Austropuccinia psidii MF-1 TaxID=1389203 RepID=A0A9Q3C6L6_9BASI|nr:hypothetical protein [Austropuccinia psidii MF-1]